MRFILISIIALITINANSQTITFGGNVSTNTTWSADTVKITDNVIIDNQATLTINEGTYIEFMGHYMIYVQGTILANGSENKLITLTSSDTTGFSNELDIAGSWYGIKFINTDATNDSSKLSFCNIEYVKDITYQDSIKPSGAIIIEHFSKLIINNCLINNNKVENEFAYLGKGGAITLLENSNPIIKNNTFSENFASADGGAIYCDKSNPKIISNIFYNNIAGNNSVGTGGAINFSYCDGIFTNDTIIAEIINNLIYNNSAYEGGGIYCYYSSANFLNNTICNNNSDFGGALHTKKSHPMFINTILFNNTATEGNQVYINHDASVCTPGNDPHFINCDLEGGVNAIKLFNDVNFMGTYENNLDINPLFNDISTNNYRLQNTSELIDNGKTDSLEIDIPMFDLAGNPRIFNDTIDIGAYENHFVDDINIIEENNFVLIYPNPTTGTITVKTENLLSISIFNTSGKMIKRTNENTIDLSNFTKGIYFVKIVTKSATKTTKLILE